MAKMLGACGLNCVECEAYKATQANDVDAVAQVAAEWSKQFGTDVPPEYVWCDGCHSDSARKCGNCAGCGVRTCVVSRDLDNCAACSDYGCETITKFFQMFPHAQRALDEIRAELH